VAVPPVLPNLEVDEPPDVALTVLQLNEDHLEVFSLLDATLTEYELPGVTEILLAYARPPPPPPAKPKPPELPAP
jgi:hypothetical protein